MKYIFKNSKLIIALTIIFAFNFTACKKKDDPKTEEPKWTNGTESTALEYLKTQAEAPATKTIDAATGGDISQNGIAITIPADMFAKSDGTPYNGSVSLKLYTVNSSSEALV